jgi:ribonuclease HI
MIIAVDGYCLSNPGKGGYQGFDISNGTSDKIKLFEVHIDDGTTTNNIVEYLAVVHALAYCQNKGIKEPSIYTDSQTAMSWVRKGYCNTTLQGKDTDTKTSRKLIERADKFLQQDCVYDIEAVMKMWVTKQKGENPADFGHKNTYYPKK